ncbi:MAG: type II toxin-antitoxin system PemK/MazF family toxin [Candidatus Binatia bacterium]
MKRGEIWTAAGGTDYTGKPRPVVVVQDDRFDATASITVCAFTSDPTDAPLIRLLVEPSDTNGLKLASRLMVDKITTVPETKLGTRIGRLADGDIVRLNRAMIVFLGLAGERRPRKVRHSRSAG